MLSLVEKTKIQNIALVGIILILVLGNSLPIDDPDVWWHLRAGQDILSTMSVPYADSYSFSNTGHMWVAHEWLAEVLYFKIYDLAGYQGLLVFNSLILACAYFLLYRIAMFQSGGNAGISAILLILSSVLNSVFWMFRPHVPAYLLFVVFLYLLYGSSTIRRNIAALPLLMVLWVNIHGSYIIGLVITISYLMSGIFRINLGRMKGRDLGKKEIRKMAVVVAATALATLVNPNTYHILLYPFETVRSGMITSNVLEWLSPDFHQLGMKFFLAYILFTFFVVAVSRQVIYADEMANLMIFTALSMFGARNLALLVFVSLPVLARHLSSLVKREHRDFQVPALNIAAILVLAILLVSLWPRPVTLEGHVGKGEFPVEAVQYMKKHNLAGNVFNEYDWGGYLIWLRYPENRVFVDGRADIYADRVIPDYLKITAAGDEAYPVFTRYDINYVLMRRGQPFLRLLQDQGGWQKIYADETAVLFRRAEEKKVGEKIQGETKMGNSIDLKQKFFSVKTLVSFLLAFAIIYLLITRMDVTEVFMVIRHTDPLLYAAGFTVYYLAFPLRGIRFHTMLKNNGCEAPTGELTRIIFISWFANCVVPAKLGDIFRAYLVRRKCGHPFINTVGTIFAERVFDLFILYLLIGISGLIAFRGIVPPAMMIVLQTSFVILAVILAVLVLMKFYSTRLVSRLPEKARVVYEKFLAGTMSSFSHNWEIAGLTTAIWFLEGASFYMVTRAIGIDLPFVNVIFIGLFSALLTALPITPAGLGFVETAKVGMLLFFQVNRNYALSAALLDRVINYWSLLIIGFIVYMATEAKLNKEVGPDESDDCHSYIQ